MFEVIYEIDIVNAGGGMVMLQEDRLRHRLLRLLVVTLRKLPFKCPHCAELSGGDLPRCAKEPRAVSQHTPPRATESLNSWWM